MAYDAGIEVFFVRFESESEHGSQYKKCNFSFSVTILQFDNVWLLIFRLRENAKGLESIINLFEMDNNTILQEIGQFMKKAVKFDQVVLNFVNENLLRLNGMFSFVLLLFPVPPHLFWYTSF